MVGYPKPEDRKKRIRHQKSILQEKDGTCYLCAKLMGDYKIHAYLEEHHVIPGAAGRRISEENGLKVYLCLPHHRGTAAAVHSNHENMLLIQRDAQRAFERSRSREDWMRIAGKNYL